MPPDGPDTGRSKRKILKDSFEHAAWQVQQLVCGVDEVGRGCLARSPIGRGPAHGSIASHDGMIPYRSAERR